MNRYTLLVFCLLTLSNVPLGQSWNSGKSLTCHFIASVKWSFVIHTTGRRIAAAVIGALRPVLNEMKEDISSIQSEMASLSETVSHLAEELEDHKIETASKLADLGSSLQSIIDSPPTEAVSTATLTALLNNLEASVNTELGRLVRERSTAISETVNDLSEQLDIMNSSVRDDFNCVKTELSSVNGIITDLGSDLQTHNQQTTSAVAQLDTRLSSLNESMRNCFDGMLGDFNMNANMTCNTTEDQETQNTTDPMGNMTEPMGMNETLTEQVGNSTACGGVGWRRAVYLDMTDPNTNCPSGWQFTGYSKRTCGRVSTGSNSCDSVFFPVIGGPYTQVCGRIRAYQNAIPDAFNSYNFDGQTTIDSAFVSGVAVMHGSPRQHIWTFANGVWENRMSSDNSMCPCDVPDYHLRYSIPPFVGEDYFCESGFLWGSGVSQFSFHADDVLWDGEDCHSSSNCCSFRNPPYFTKTLGHTTTDDLELRLCLNNAADDEDNIAVELVELYVM